MPSTITTARGVLAHIWRDPANQGRRVRAVARALGFQVKGRLFHRPSVARVGANGKILCHLHSAGASSMLYANPPDFWETLFWRESVLRGGSTANGGPGTRPGPTVFCLAAVRSRHDHSDGCSEDGDRGTGGWQRSRCLRVSDVPMGQKG